MPLIPRHIPTQQIIMLLCQAKRVWRWTVNIVSILLCNALSIWTSWPLLGCSGTEAIIIILAWTKTALAPLIRLLGIRVLTSGHSLSAAHDVTGGLNAMILIHLIIKCSSPHRPTRFKNTELLLIQNLRISEALVRICLPKMRRAHNLLGHH